LAERWCLSAAFKSILRERYLVPQPRNAIAQALRDHASAAMDISDGLAGDLAKLCRASGVAAEVDAAAVPLSEAARVALAADSRLVESILTGGDDYEILSTVPPAKFAAFGAAAAKVGITVSKIGEIGSGQGVRFRRHGKVLSFARSAYTHF
jgi:thiamine-monophosphate kinase